MTEILLTAGCADQGSICADQGLIDGSSVIKNPQLIFLVNLIFS